jgi:plastocyanin
MLRSRSSIPGILVAAATALVAWAPASAQTACVTPNCVFAGTPAKCANVATPRVPTVQMGQGLNLVFVPANPKIEPGDCITWRAATATHSSSGASCDPADFDCGSPAPPECEWDSANVSSVSATPTSTCYYDPVLFPAEAANDFHCRLHATMLGKLAVTTPIVLSLAKDLGTNSVVLSWTGGGVTGDVSYKVVRQTGGNPRFPVGATTTTVNPDGGVLGTSLVDVGALTNPTTRYYLVRNKQSNES